MTKFGHQPVLGAKESHQKYGPASYQTPVPRVASQSITPRGGVGGGSVSVASTVQSTPRDRASVASFHCNGQRRPPEKEKKWHLRGWEMDNRVERQDDDIVGWVKRRTGMEAKRGTKRHPAVLDNEFYIPVNNRCPNTEDFERLKQESLHSRFFPKVKLNRPSQAPVVTLKYSSTSKTEEESAGANMEATINAQKEEREPVDHVQRVMQKYRDAKHAVIILEQEGSLLGRRSKSFPDLNSKYNIEQRNKIKRLLKFSNQERKFNRFDEDEDEGYCSKTSSAETKGLSDSDNEDGSGALSKNRLSNSMVNLSELPSNISNKDQEKEKGRKADGATKDVQNVDTARVKFSYTHQPTILQIPNPDLKLVRNNVRAERAAASEEVPFSYSRLKRAKELNKCYKIDQTKFVQENSVYDISTQRPRAESPKAVTLVLRKISIQNADQNVTSVVSTADPSSFNASESNQVPRSDSRVGSALSRSGSAASRIGSSKSRSGSAKSRANSATSRCSLTPQMEFKTRMQQKHVRPTNHKESQPDLSAKSSKEPMWSQEYSLIERHATSYCIGDLLPAMDKSIYTSQYVKGKVGAKHQGRKYHGMAPLLTDAGRREREEPKVAKDDGCLVLHKGMDALAGDKEKFQNKKKTLSPIYGKGEYSPMRFSSERGPRPMMQSPEKETQRKLKEAFSKFYQNRPKEIGKEFRRMQTMWNG